MTATTLSRPVPRQTGAVLRPRLRKSILIVHILSAGIWIGVDVLVAVLVLTGWFSDDPATRTLAYRSLSAFVIWPMLTAALVCLVSGVVLGLGTKWGLVRYWWVAVKLVLNVAMCVLIAFVLRPGLGELRTMGADAVSPDLFFPPAVSLTLLTIATVLSVFKPWGRTRQR